MRAPSPPWLDRVVRLPSRMGLAVLLAAGLAAPALAEPPRPVLAPEIREPTERDRERAARHALQNARGLRHVASIAPACLAAPGIP